MPPTDGAAAGPDVTRSGTPRAPLGRGVATGLAGPALAVVAALAPTFGTAQVPWETPRLIGPESPTSFSLLWTRFGTLPGDGEGVVAVWGTPGLPAGVTLRFGGAEGAGDRNAYFGGVDVRSPLVRHRPEQPFDLSWTAGAGLGAGNYALLTVPVGVTAGRSWAWGSVWLAPYLSAGVSLDLALGDDAPGEAFDISATMDVGLDLALDRARRLILRVATALGDRHALALGVAFAAGADPGGPGG